MNGIGEVLGKYGASLEETRKLVPELTEAIKKRKKAAIPTAPQFLTSFEAKEYGVDIDEGWLLKLTPGVEGDGFKTALITPDKWEISDVITGKGGQVSDFSITSPEGQSYTKESYEAELSAHAPPYEPPPLEPEEVFGKVFPERDAMEVLAYASDNPEQFYEDVWAIGRTPEVEQMFRMMGADKEWVEEFFAPMPLTEQAKAALRATPWLTPPASWSESIKGFPGLMDIMQWLAPTKGGAALGVAGAYIVKYVGRPWEVAILEANSRIKALGLPGNPPQGEFDREIIQKLDDLFAKYGSAAIFSEEVSEIWEHAYEHIAPGQEWTKTFFEWTNPVFWMPIGGVFGKAAQFTSKIPIIGRTMRYTAGAVQGLERGITYPVTKPLSLGLRGLEKAGFKMGEALSDKLISESAHLVVIEDLAKATNKGILDGLLIDNWMKRTLTILSKIPPMKAGIEKGLGWRILIQRQGRAVEDIVGRGAIIENFFERMGVNAKNPTIYSLRAIETNPIKYFGLEKGFSSKMASRLLPEYKEVPNVGTLEHVITHPEMYNWQGWGRTIALSSGGKANAGLVYVTRVNEINKAVLNLLKKEGIPPEHIIEDWIHRVIQSEGRKIRRGGKAIGAAQPFEKHRKFETMADGIAWFNEHPELGAHYASNPEISVAEFVEQALRKVGHERFIKYVAQHPEIQAIKPSARLLEQYPELAAEVVLRAEELADAKHFGDLIKRASRGERTPTQTLNAMELRFPELGRRFRALVDQPATAEKELREILKANEGMIKNLQAKLGKAEAVDIKAIRAEAFEKGMGARVSDEQKLTEAFKAMDFEDRLAFRSTMESQVDDIGRMVYEQDMELAGLTESLSTDMVATYTVNVGKRKVHLDYFIKKGDFPETFTLKEAAALMEKRIENIQTRVIVKGVRTDRVPREVVLDNLAEHFGMEEKQLIDHIAFIAQQKIKAADLKFLVGMADGRIKGIKRMLGILDNVDTAPANIPASYEMAKPYEPVATTRIAELAGLEVELPVARAVHGLVKETPLSSGFHEALNKRWTIVFEGRVSAKVAQAAKGAGLEVKVRITTAKTTLTDVSLPGVGKNKIDEATRAFDKFAENYMGAKEYESFFGGARAKLPEAGAPSPIIHKTITESLDPSDFRGIEVNSAFRKGVPSQLKAEERATVDRLIEAVPDKNDTRVINYWRDMGDETVYLEGWCDKCLAHTGYPKIGGGSWSEKIQYMLDDTSRTLLEKQKERGYTLIEGGFREFQAGDRGHLYGVTWGVYRKKITVPKAEAGMPEAGIQKDIFGYEVPRFPKGKGVVTQIGMDDYGKLVKARKDAGLPPPDVGVKPKIEGVKGLEAETQAAKVRYKVPEVKSGAERKAGLQELLNEVKGLTEARKMPYWEAKAERAFRMQQMRQAGLEEGYIMQPFAGGKIFEQEFIDAFNKFFGHESGLAALKVTSDVAGILRITKAALDFSMQAIQGMPSWGLAHAYLLINPPVGARLMGAWYKNFVLSIGSFFDASILARVLDKKMAVGMQRIAMGGSSRTVDYFAALEAKTGLGGLGEAAMRKIPLKPYHRAETAFFGAGEMIRNDFWEILRPVVSKRISRGLAPEYAEHELARLLDRFTGIADSTAAGVPLTIRQLEQSFVWFAPNYTRACLDVLSMVFRGGFTGAEARKALGGMIAAGSIMYSGVQYAMASMEGKSHEDAMRTVEEGFCVVHDPITGETEWRPSARFMTLKIGNYYFGIGGFWYGLLRLGGNIMACVNEVGDRERIDLVRIMKHGSFNKKDNAFIYWWYSRSSPFFGSAFEMSTGKDFLGYPIETPTEYAEYIATRFEPIWMEQGLNWLVPGLARENEIPEGLARPALAPAELFGLRTFPESTWVDFYDKAAEYIKRLPRDLLAEYFTAEELPKILKLQAEGELKYEHLPELLKAHIIAGYPEAEELYKTAQADSVIRNTPHWKAWVGRQNENRSVYYERGDNLVERLTIPTEIDTRELRELWSEAGQNFGAHLDEMEESGVYEVVYGYLEKKRAEGYKYDWDANLALSEYIAIMFADYRDEKGDIDWDAKDRAIDGWIEDWGEDWYGLIRQMYAEGKLQENLHPILVRLSDDKDKLGRDYWRLPYKPIMEMDEDDDTEGNIPAQYYSLWQACQGLGADELEDFAKRHPEMAKDWRAEYRRENPEDDARLALWGYGGKLQSMDAYNLVEQWSRELGIPLEQAGLGLPPRQLIKPYFEYAEILSNFSGNSAEVKLWRLENPEFTNWAMDNWGWEGSSDYKGMEYYRIQTKWRKEEAEYDAIEDKEARLQYLNAHTEYRDDRRRLDAMGYEFPEDLIETYVQYYTEVERAGYEDDWFLMEHDEFYQSCLELLEWEPRDFTKVPTREVYELLQNYFKIPDAKQKLVYRHNHLNDLEEWLVRVKGYTPVGDRWMNGKGNGKEKGEDKTPWEEQKEAEKMREFIEKF